MSARAVAGSELGAVRGVIERAEPVPAIGAVDRGIPPVGTAAAGDVAEPPARPRREILHMSTRQAAMAAVR